MTEFEREREQPTEHETFSDLIDDLQTRRNAIPVPGSIINRSRPNLGRKVPARRPLGDSPIEDDNWE